MEKQPLIFNKLPDVEVGAESLGPVAAKKLGSVLSWENIIYKVKEKTILNKVSGEAKPGELLAIMGPSGAGKSTLLNVLAGRISQKRSVVLEGDISVNGNEVDPANFRSRIAYVMQEDALFATQTPLEALHFSAALRLSKDTTNPQREKLVNNLLGQLGLKNCQNTYIGSVMLRGISGGEKKRTAIGVELISDPEILFLDEPTSGLDSYAAFNVVKILQRLSASGCTVVCTIHQPSSEVFSLFDKVLLLAKGSTVYHGPVTGVPQYFTEVGFPCPPHYNPADHMMFVVQEEAEGKLTQIINHWQNEATSRPRTRTNSINIATLHTGNIPESKIRAGFFTQLAFLAVREGRNVIRDKAALGGRFGITIFLNLISALVFQGAGTSNTSDPQIDVQNHFGALSQVAIGGMFGLAQPLLLAFPLERPVFLREYATGTYGPLPYFISKVFIEIPMCIIQSLVMYLMVYWIMGLQGNFILLVLTTALLGLVASSTALIIGAVSANVNAAVQISPLLFVPQFLFAGLFIRTSSIPVYLRWAQYLCSLKYGLNLISLTEFGSDDNNYAVAKLLDTNNIKKDSVWIYIGIMLAAFVVFRFMALIVLSYKGRNLSQ